MDFLIEDVHDQSYQIKKNKNERDFAPWSQEV